MSEPEFNVETSEPEFNVEKYDRLKSRLRTLQAGRKDLSDDYQAARLARQKARERWEPFESVHKKAAYRYLDNYDADYQKAKQELERAERIFDEATKRLEEHREELDYLGGLVTRLDDYLEARGIEVPETSMVSSPGARRVGLRDRDHTE